MSDVLVECRDSVQWIIINRSERRNALNDDVVAAIANGIKTASENPQIRAIVLTGAGNKIFCAGGDLKPAADGSPFEDKPAQPDHPVIKLFRQIEGCNLPIIARVNGHAMGGGLGLVCACDIAIGAESALLATPEVKIGLFPLTILSYMLRVIPRRKLMEMCITGEPWTAEQAKEVGILNYVAPDNELDEKVDWMLNRITDKSPSAIRLGKYSYHAMQDMSLKECFDFSQIYLPVMARTEDAKEGFAAFNDGRKPNWTGK